MEILRSAWKAIAAFLVVFLGQLVDNLASSNGSVALPQSVGEWSSAVGLALVGAVIVYVLPNRYTPPQVESHLDRLPEAAQKNIMRARAEQHPNWT